MKRIMTTAIVAIVRIGITMVQPSQLAIAVLCAVANRSILEICVEVVGRDVWMQDGTIGIIIMS